MTIDGMEVDKKSVRIFRSWTGFFSVSVKVRNSPEGCEPIAIFGPWKKKEEAVDFERWLGKEATGDWETVEGGIRQSVTFFVKRGV